VCWAVLLGGAVVTGRCEIGCWVLDHRCRAGFGIWRLWRVCWLRDVTDGCVAMGSLWIVNQVLVRFGRAGRLGGFLLGRASGLAGIDGGGP